MFGFAKYNRMPGIFIKLSLPTADTSVHNSHILFSKHCEQSVNNVICWSDVLRL